MSNSDKICPFCKSSIPADSEKCPICSMVLIERIKTKLNNPVNKDSDTYSSKSAQKKDIHFNIEQRLDNLSSTFISWFNKLYDNLNARKKLIFAIIFVGFLYIILSSINKQNDPQQTIYSKEINPSSPNSQKSSNISKKNIDKPNPSANLSDKRIPAFDDSKPYPNDDGILPEKILPEKYYPNGKIFSRKKYYFSGLGELNIKNGTDNDAVAKLVNVSTNKSVLTIFIRRQSNLNINKIRDGNYRLYFVLGYSYNEEQNIFMQDCSFSVFEEDFEYSTHTKKVVEGIKKEYCIFEVTLHSVIGGTARINTITKNEFLSL